MSVVLIIVRWKIRRVSQAHSLFVIWFELWLFDRWFHHEQALLRADNYHHLSCLSAWCHVQFRSFLRHHRNPAWNIHKMLREKKNNHPKIRTWQVESLTSGYVNSMVLLMNGNAYLYLVAPMIICVRLKSPQISNCTHWMSLNNVFTIIRSKNAEIFAAIVVEELFPISFWRVSKSTDAFGFERIY